MTVPELKKKIIGKISSSKDPELLEEVYRLMNSDAEDSKVYVLSEEQKSVVEEAIKQIDNGDLLSGEESDAEVKQWLGE
ncbi:MAG: hypothetical protein NTV01_15235 [Bacteroidia bacterium]|nr:hypothetical protein [Bacteroidia bacterium]